jgi:hypothetical protein
MNDGNIAIIELVSVFSWKKEALQHYNDEKIH